MLSIYYRTSTVVLLLPWSRCSVLKLRALSHTTHAHMYNPTHVTTTAVINNSMDKCGICSRTTFFQGRDLPFCAAVEPCTAAAVETASIKFPNQNILALPPIPHRRIMLSRSTMDGRNLFFFLRNSLSAAHLHKVCCFFCFTLKPHSCRPHAICKQPCCAVPCP